MKKIASSPFLFVRFVFTISGAIAWLVAIGAGIGLSSFYASLPDVQRPGFDGIKKRATHQVNRRLHKPETTKRPWTELEQVSRDLLYAIVLSEDAGFFDHAGVEVDAILAATIQNLRKKKYDSGASTITQQVVKNLFFTDSKSLIRKTKEVIIARDFDAVYSKNQILEIYLNIAEFGPDLYGIKEASFHYFGKNPSQVNAAEGAFLAIMLPSPRKFHYSVYENQNLTPEKKKRIRRILTDMLSNEFISPKQYREYLKYNFFKRAHEKSAQR